jgi:hypothetical protein
VPVALLCFHVHKSRLYKQCLVSCEGGCALARPRTAHPIARKEADGVCPICSLSLSAFSKMLVELVFIASCVVSCVHTADCERC